MADFQGLCCGFVLEGQRSGVAPLEVDDFARAFEEEAPECGPGVASVRIGDCSMTLAEDLAEI